MQVEEPPKRGYIPLGSPQLSETLKPLCTIDSFKYIYEYKVVSIMNLEFFSISIGGVIVIILCCSLIIYFFSKKSLPSKKRASLVLITGIFGTFLGVTMSLISFDTSPENFDQSVPNLISGLQTAFITSLFGLFFNIIIRFKEKTETNSDDLGEELLRVIKSLTKSISDDSESSLVSQFKLLRTENTDGFKRISDSFESFAEKIVEDNSKSLIEALEEVIRDFNSKISEQLGDNFKKFNESLSVMLDWHKEYKEQVNNLVTDYKEFRSSAGSLDKTLENISNNHNSIKESNQKLYDLIKDFSTEVNSFAELGQKASTSLPLIEEKVTSIVSLSNEHLTVSVDNLKKDIESISSTHKNLIDTFNERIKGMIDSSSTRVEEFDKQLGEELTKSLEKFGNSMATLSNKFADDYTPITENVKKLIDSLNAG